MKDIVIRIKAGKIEDLKLILFGIFWMHPSLLLVFGVINFLLWLDMYIMSTLVFMLYLETHLQELKRRI